MKRLVFSLILFTVTLAAEHLPAAITFGPFGANGEGGTRNGQDFRIGTGGSVYEYDAFVGVGAQDLNGSASGTSAQLSHQSLPDGLACKFSTQLSADKSDLVLTYVLSNKASTNFD